MDGVIYWIGVVHLAAYAVAGMVIAAGIFSEWLIRRLRLKRELVRAYQRVLEDREAAKKAKDQSQ